MSNDLILKKAGEIIYREGEKAASLYIIKKGTIRLLKLKEDRVVVMANLFAKDVFGSEDIFKKSLYSNNAVALEDSELVKISAEDVRSQIKSMPNWIDRILAMLSGRLNDTEEILLKHKIYQSSLNDEVVVSKDIEATIKNELID